jgi:hypothetical protein
MQVILSVVAGQTTVNVLMAGLFHFAKTAQVQAPFQKNCPEISIFADVTD